MNEIIRPTSKAIVAAVPNGEKSYIIITTDDAAIAINFNIAEKLANTILDLSAILEIAANKQKKTIFPENTLDLNPLDIIISDN